MNARWLDPQTGQLLSVDPAVASAADPQAYNAYAYARNNPVRHGDPTGGFIACWGCDAANELASCNRCGGFSMIAGYSMDGGGSAPSVSEAPVAPVVESGAASRSAAGGGSPTSPQSSPTAGPAGGGVDGGGFAGLGDAASAAGAAIARVAEIVAWDLALAAVGAFGNAFGFAAGLVMAVEGLLLLNPTMVARGFESSFWALVPRYGFWSGPGWGRPNFEAWGWWFGPFTNQNVIEGATYNHDYAFQRAGADRALVHDVWTRNDLGPLGQIYRVGLTGLFGARIALGMDD
jgi:hypothetical protein